MISRALSAAVLSAIVIHLAGCDGSPASKRPNAKTLGQVAAPSVAAAPASAATSRATSMTASPSEPPAVATVIDPHERDPAKVMAQIAAAFARRDWAAVRGAWGDHGNRSGMSAQQLARVWQPYRTLNIAYGKGEQEGAAGSSYYEAPVTITGEKLDGKPYHLEGTITLRRVNDVDGATPEQLRWHIESTTLKP